MRSFVEIATVLLMLLPLPAALAAQSGNARQVYTDALKREAELRRELDAHTASEPAAALLQRIRTLVGAYSDMARLFPNNEQGDNALWQGAMLSADTFWRFGDEIDRAAALNLLDALTMRYPGSPRTAQAEPHVQRLANAPVLTPVPPFSGARPALRAEATPAATPPSSDPPPAPSAASTAQDVPAAVSTSAATPTPRRPSMAVPAVPDATDAAAPSAGGAAGQTQTAAARPASAAAAAEPRASSAPRTASASAPVAAPAEAPGPSPRPEPPGASTITSTAIPPVAVDPPVPQPEPSRTAAAPTPLIDQDELTGRAARATSGGDVARAPAVAPVVPATPAGAAVVAPAAGPARLTAISGESMGDAIRFTLSLEREVAVRHHQLGGPPRIVIDLQDTAPAETLTQAMLPAGADVISRIRVGRHDATSTRVVIELRAPSRYEVFVAQEPHRVLIEVHPRLAALSTDASATVASRQD